MLPWFCAITIFLVWNGKKGIPQLVSAKQHSLPHPALRRIRPLFVDELVRHGG